MSNITLETLNSVNFPDYETLTCKEANGKTGCYCAFWHQKWNSLEEWEKRQKEEPLKNRDMVKAKMHGGFHVGVLVYEENNQNKKLIGWVSLGPLTDFNWTMKRALNLGTKNEDAQKIAGILCFNLAPDYRGKGYQETILKELITYAKNQGWNTLEGYPFDPEAREKHAEKIAWPGYPESFVGAGFIRHEAHWLSQKDWERSIFRFQL